MARLLDRPSKLTLNHKLLIYNAQLKPIWTCGPQSVRFSAKYSSIYRLQTLQLQIVPRLLLHTTSLTEPIHFDLKVPIIQDLIIDQLSFFTLPDKPSIESMLASRFTRHVYIYPCFFFSTQSPIGKNQQELLT